ncbi:hypothetical protein QLX08_005906 [Tetragonisca angustula]|uniref:Uncharacterized protein n=1 Tax=Tetragonisca angustula TaxID=166442 RepID=A0AAW0ZWE1_9HYME
MESDAAQPPSRILTQKNRGTTHEEGGRICSRPTRYDTPNCGISKRSTLRGSLATPPTEESSPHTWEGRH